MAGLGKHIRGGGQAKLFKASTPIKKHRELADLSSGQMQQPPMMGPDSMESSPMSSSMGSAPGMKKGGSTNWIQGAIKHPGSLRKSLGVKSGQKIPASKLAAAAKKPGKMGKRARLAQTLKGLKK